MKKEVSKKKTTKKTLQKQDKALIITFVGLIVLVIALAIVALNMKTITDREKANIVIPILEEHSENVISVELNDMAKGDVKEYILNRYYMEYNSILPDSVFDIFKYNGSIVKEEGCITHPRLIKPRIKARLVSKNSNIDTFEPEVFNRVQYKVITIEQRYDMVVNMDNPEEITTMQDALLSMKGKGICYSERYVSKYNISKQYHQRSYT